MRIVSGSARGRRLLVPEGFRTRPTSDRVREATFNALFSLGAIEDATYCDLFAGSGALGLEALSRGAAHATFVERDRAALDMLRRNIDTLGFAASSTVVAGDAIRWLASAPHHDVVLADPPYDFDTWPAILATVRADLLVAESNRAVQPDHRWEMVRDRSYGSTVVTILAGIASAQARPPTVAPEESTP